MELSKESTTTTTFQYWFKGVQNLMFTIVALYKLIRLFNFIKENKMDLHLVMERFLKSVKIENKEYYYSLIYAILESLTRGIIVDFFSFK